MCERNINWLPLTCPHLGTGPTTQACALTRNQTRQPVGFQDDAEPIERHQSGHASHYFKIMVLLDLQLDLVILCINKEV